MIRKIYILFFGVHYESESILAVYSDINEAKDHLVAESHSVDDIKIKEDKMSSDNGCCYYIIRECLFSDNLKVESEIVFGRGNVGVGTGFAISEGSGKLVPLIQLSKLNKKGEIGKTSKDDEREQVLSTLYFESIESLEVLQLAINKAREMLNEK